ncbi:MAG: hypothetical protein WD907_01285 [Bacilli bacterium]
MQASQRISRIMEVARHPQVNLTLIAMRKRVFNTLFRLLHYTILISISFIFMYPMLYLISKSMMQSYDLADATVQWIPKGFSFANYDFAYTSLIYIRSFFNSMMTSLVPALIQIISCAIVGYGFARYHFPG